ncbi:FAS2-like protein [Mya arenaria]|uniref:FAS2-like protein n=1 Tax=Mya arenaria TaxID=6604 RepID=A0ABY7EC14_MYAAR|nr:FAS2-like protein [Mya arenaria]
MTANLPCSKSPVQQIPRAASLSCSKCPDDDSKSPLQQVSSTANTPCSRGAGGGQKQIGFYHFSLVNALYHVAEIEMPRKPGLSSSAGNGEDERLGNSRLRLVNPRLKIVNPRLRLVNSRLRPVNPRLWLVNSRLWLENSRLRLVNPRLRLVISRLRLENSRLKLAEASKFKAEASKFKAEASKSKAEASKFKDEASKFKAEACQSKAEAKLLFDPGESMREVKTRDLFFVNCLLNSSIPSPSNLEIKWFDKTGAEITSSSPSDHVYAIARGGGKELNIDTVEDDDGGNYQCKAVVDGVVAYERTLSIRVEVYAFETTYLVILNTTKESEGIYKYYAWAKNVKKSRAITFKVLAPPTVKEFSNLIENRYQGTEGGSVTLTCEARGDPAPNVIWRKVGTNQQFTVGSSSETISVTEDTINDPTNPGIVLKLGMKNLAALDGGMYECEAKNKAVSPNFDGQETEYDRTFYTWAGNPNGDVVCVSNANPEPVFRWYHNGQEIKQGTTGYGLSQKASDDENYPYRHYSTLSVAFNGGNDDVFGSYVCQAANRINSNNQTLSLVKATVPPKPNVITKEQLPTQMTFWLMEPSVDGPEVTHFTVTYKISGSPEEAQVITIEKEFRDHIDADRKYTIIIVNDLLPSSEYTFTFFAKNAVGPGAGEEKRLGTPAIKEPAMVNIMSPSNSQYPTRIRVTWDEPNNGGSEILSYKVSYQQVEVRLSNQTLPTPGYQLQRPITNPITKDAIKDKFYDIQDLVPGSFYQVKVSATNNKGEGVAGTKIILTKQDPNYQPVSKGASVVVATVTTTLVCLIATFYACFPSFV